MDEPKPRYSAPAVEKAFAVLELISRHPDGLRMVDIVQLMRLPKTSTFVLLRSLERMGYLTGDEQNRYRLSLKLFELGMRANKQTDLTTVAEPHLDRLVEQTGLTAHLAALEDGQAVYLAKVERQGFVRFDTFVGKRTPAHLTAVGKAILAALPDDELDRVLPDLDLAAGTTRAVHTARGLRRELTDIRANGYAVEDGEEVEGVICLAASVRPADGPVVGSVGVIGLRSGLDDARLRKLGAEVADAAAAVAADVVPRSH